MKILCLSDLHIQTKFDLIIKQIKELKKNIIFDVVIISGDIFESVNCINPYKFLSELFDNKLVICTLGNHEFFYKRYNDVIQLYTEKYEPTLYNVHYLDIIKYYDTNNIRFLGGFLGYDGSLKTNTKQVIEKWADYCWADRLIKNWDKEWKNVNDLYLNNIKKSYNKNKNNILITHTVPHEFLNLHNINSKFNVYSGMKNLLKDYNFEYCICGHTHKRTIGKVIEDCSCINVGSDYDYLQYYVLEV